MTAQHISTVLRELANPAIAKTSRRFFKTGKGEYGEGDQFLGIRVPILRGLVKQYQATALEEIQKLLTSAWHEERLFALLLLVFKFTKGDSDEATAIYQFYLNNTQHINNWDLVDCSAYYIVGAYLDSRDRQVLYQLVQSHSLWERRIAIIATFHLIRNNQFEDTLQFSQLLINDKEDLIHKAVEWMLREMGKRDITAEKVFLKAHYLQMPRTMLRYAVEKFPEQERKQYLAGDV